MDFEVIRISIHGQCQIVKWSVTHVSNYVRVKGPQFRNGTMGQLKVELISIYMVVENVEMNVFIYRSSCEVIHLRSA